MSNTHCSRCGEKFPPPPDSGASGYATRVSDGKRICYKCCGVEDEELMSATGRITLYFSYNSPYHNPRFTRSGINLTASDYKVSNWPGSLFFWVKSVRVGLHNIAGRRWDVWFHQGGFVWHGVCYGDNTQLLHCKRTKVRVQKAAA